MVLFSLTGTKNSNFLLWRLFRVGTSSRALFVCYTGSRFDPSQRVRATSTIFKPFDRLLSSRHHEIKLRYTIILSSYSTLGGAHKQHTHDSEETSGEGRGLLLASIHVSCLRGKWPCIKSQDLGSGKPQTGRPLRCLATASRREPIEGRSVQRSRDRALQGSLVRY